MPPEHPLLATLAVGTAPFRYRSRVRALLGLPLDHGVRVGLSSRTPAPALRYLRPYPRSSGVGAPSPGGSAVELAVGARSLAGAGPSFHEMAVPDAAAAAASAARRGTRPGPAHRAPAATGPRAAPSSTVFSVPAAVDGAPPPPVVREPVAPALPDRPGAPVPEPTPAVVASTSVSGARADLPVVEVPGSAHARTARSGGPDTASARAATTAPTPARSPRPGVGPPADPRTTARPEAGPRPAPPSAGRPGPEPAAVARPARASRGAPAHDAAEGPDGPRLAPDPSAFADAPRPVPADVRTDDGSAEALWPAYEVTVAAPSAAAPSAAAPSIAAPSAEVSPPGDPADPGGSRAPKPSAARRPRPGESERRPSTPGADGGEAAVPAQFWARRNLGHWRGRVLR